MCECACIHASLTVVYRLCSSKVPTKSTCKCEVTVLSLQAAATIYMYYSIGRVINAQFMRTRDYGSQVCVCVAYKLLRGGKSGFPIIQKGYI